MRSGAGFDLYVIVDGSERHLGRAERLLGGVDAHRIAIQLRMKDRPIPEVRAAARRLRACTTRSGSAMVLNAGTTALLELAAELDADGVQLPAKRSPAPQARAILGPSRRVGMSCHDAAELAQAEAEGADFLVLSPLYGVPDKGPPLGPSRFAALSQATSLPVVALGGITAERVPEALRAGAHAVAAIRSVLDADDPAWAAQDLLQALDRWRTEPPSVQT